jgi:hypothetical protein
MSVRRTDPQDAEKERRLEGEAQELERARRVWRDLQEAAENRARQERATHTLALMFIVVGVVLLFVVPLAGLAALAVGIGMVYSP